jgi:hypothetical protein
MAWDLTIQFSSTFLYGWNTEAWSIECLTMDSVA